MARINNNVSAPATLSYSPRARDPPFSTLSVGGGADVNNTDTLFYQAARSKSVQSFISFIVCVSFSYLTFLHEIYVQIYQTAVLSNFINFMKNLTNFRYVIVSGLCFCVITIYCSRVVSRKNVDA